jgi:hypothetical protein
MQAWLTANIVHASRKAAAALSLCGPCTIYPTHMHACCESCDAELAVERLQVGGTVEGVYELGPRRAAVLQELKGRAVEAAVGNGAIRDTCKVLTRDEALRHTTTTLCPLN